MGRAIDAVLRKLTRTGFRRALGGEHWAWFVVAGAAYMLRRARQPSDDVARLDLADLQPGQGYEIRLVRPRSSRDRRRAGRPAADHPG